ncbi:hypothetical protein Bca101_025021 [Brassica carinata]
MVMYGGGAWKDGESNNHISDGGGGGLVLKKGTWTTAEDEMLAAYLGNKWARMAAQLPGRTDNEIKNYWNTRWKRLQRQGLLPLYPPDIIPNHQLHPHPHHRQQMYFQPQSSQPCTPSSSSPLPSPTPANAKPSSSFSFHTKNSSTANLLYPLSPHTPSTLPLSSPLSSPHHSQYPTLPLFSQINNNSNNANFTFPRPPPLLQPPSSLFAKRNNNANASLNCINRVSAAPFSSVPRDSYTSFLTSPYSSPNAQTITYYNTNNNYSSSPSFSVNPSSYPTSTSSPSFLHSHYTPNSPSTSLHTNTSYSMKQELSSNQTPQIGAFDNVNNFTDNEKQNNTGFHRRSVSCSLLEDVLKEVEALADGGGG